MLIHYLTSELRFECGLVSAEKTMGCIPWYLPQSNIIIKQISIL